MAYSTKPAVTQNTSITTIARVEQSLSDIVFSPEEVKKTILKVNVQSAPGPDQLPGCIFKKCVKVLAPALTCLMNRSFVTGYSHQDCKHAIVTRIYKKGDKTIATNFWPISLTSVVVKMKEKIINHHITRFLNRECIVSFRQHGFVEKRFTITNLLTCVHSWYNEVHTKNKVDVVYLDFERAFDKVPHQR